MKPKSTLALGALFSVAAALPLMQCAQAAPKKNIIFILSDDQRRDVLGCYGNTLIKTPTIDGLAAQGVRFDNFYCESPICNVSRASLITGLSQRTHGTNFSAPPVDSKYIATSYPAVLKANGYRTGFTGKYGFNFSKNDKPQQFDFFKPYTRTPYLKKMPDGTLRHETDLCADAAVEFLESNPKDKPFCPSVSFNASHAEDGDHRPGFHFQWPESTNGLYNDMTLPLPKLNDPKYFAALPPFLQDEKGLSRARFFWRWDTPEKYQVNMRAYWRMATGIDNAVARVLAELKKTGLDKNTVIVYAADNGMMLGDRGLAGKWNHYDQSFDVPFIVYDPTLPVAKRGRVVKELGSFLDVAPTFVEWAGLKVPEVYQGKSLVNLVDGNPTPNWREDFFCEHAFKSYPSWYGVRGKRYKYAVYYEDGPTEIFYDLQKDPTEFTNLANDKNYTDIKSQMAARLKSYLDEYPLAGKPVKEDAKTAAMGDD